MKSLQQLRDLYGHYLFEDFLPFMDKYVIDHQYGGFMCNTDVVGWRRRAFHLNWAWVSRRKHRGEPEVGPEIRTLIRRMAGAKPLGGAPQIHGELLKLGIKVSERTVSRLMPSHRKSPSQTWKAFLNTHVMDLVSMDFFTVPTATFRVLFVATKISLPEVSSVHRTGTDDDLANHTLRSRRVGIHDFTFEAYLSFTCVTACQVARPPDVGFLPRLRPSQLPGSAAR